MSKPNKIIKLYERPLAVIFDGEDSSVVWQDSEDFSFDASETTILEAFEGEIPRTAANPVPPSLPPGAVVGYDWPKNP